jgi:hypothetical protein
MHEFYFNLLRTKVKISEELISAEQGIVSLRKRRKKKEKAKGKR